MVVYGVGLILEGLVDSRFSVGCCFLGCLLCLDLPALL